MLQLYKSFKETRWHASAQLYGAMFQNTDIHSHRFEAPKSQNKRFCALQTSKMLCGIELILVVLAWLNRGVVVW